MREVVLIKIPDLIRFLIQPCKIGSSCVRKGCKQVFPYGTSLKNHMATKHGGGKLLMMISLERGHCQVGEEELTRGRKQLRDRSIYYKFDYASLSQTKIILHSPLFND